jgi:hypothetical protein
MIALPQDLAGLLAVAIRDVIWFKDKVVAFLKNCGVPEGVMVDVRRTHREKVPTIKLVHHVLDRLAEKGDEGHLVARRLLTTMHHWKDMHTVPTDRKEQAIASLKALQAGVKLFESQESYRREQQELERGMHREREQRGKLSSLDHAKLAAFRDEFDRVSMLDDPQERGNKFQDLMNRVFDYYCQESKGAFKRTGEQIDGLFKFEMHWWYVEIRWKKGAGHCRRRLRAPRPRQGCIWWRHQGPVHLVQRVHQRVPRSLDRSVRRP